jgi:hypothetical protein
MGAASGNQLVPEPVRDMEMPRGRGGLLVWRVPMPGIVSGVPVDMDVVSCMTGGVPRCAVATPGISNQTPAVMSFARHLRCSPEEVCEKRMILVIA